MYDLVLQIIVFGSLGFIIYLMARALPRVEDNVHPPRGPNWVERVFSKIPMSRLDSDINNFLARFLHRLRALILKLESFVSDRLGKLTKKTSGDKVNNDKPQDLVK